MKHFPLVLLVALLLQFYPGALHAGVIKQLSYKIDLQDNGSALVSIMCRFDSLTSATLLVPFCFTACDSLKFNNEINPAVFLVDSNTVKYISIPSALLQAKSSFTLSMQVKGYYIPEAGKTNEFGHIAIKQKFVNTTVLFIRGLQVKLVLPAGYVVSTVDESIPKLSNNNPEAPYAVLEENGRHAVELTAKNLRLGDNAMVALTIKQEKKSDVFLWILLAAIAAYAILFRDILKPASKKGVSG
ncbi:MAG: hypothetical protein HY965_03595 [Ignavibacteriales bacterium]|nr:hypothetical protein [Ignavibacteriales bacterium]